MERNKLEQEPPFHPTPHYNQESGNMNGFSDGISIRLYVSTMAMQGILGNPSWVESLKIKDDWDDFKKRVIEGAIDLADEMIQQLNGGE